MSPENPVETLTRAIKSLGPNTVAAYCQYSSHERAKAAANYIVDNDSQFLALARDKKAVIGTVKMADGSALIFGGLLSTGHMTRLYQDLLAEIRPDSSELAI